LCKGERRARIDLIRHGEPEGGDRYRGDGVDDPLSEQGWAQMWAALPGTTPWTRIVTSPLRRCRSFAEAVAARRGLPVAVEPDLREVGFGAWEGLAKADIRARWPGALEAFQADPVANRPEGAEPLQAFCDRVQRALERIWEAGDGPVLVVAHAGVLRAAAAQALGLPLPSMYRLRIAYAGWARLGRDWRGTGLERWNAPTLEPPS
jgi:probable phosphoglycerate mutase